MKALVKTKPGKGNMEILDYPIPEPEDSEILVKVEKAGICGSDIHFYEWESQVQIKLPVVVGHEFSGQIAGLGSEVSNLKLGERIVVEPSAYVCERCDYCRSGNYNLCTERLILGFGKNGGFSEYVAVPAKRIHKIPHNISWDEAAVIEPFACCVHAVKDKLNYHLGDVVAITGPGTIGLMILQLMHMNGLKVIMIGTSADEGRLDLAKSLGADYVFNVDSTPVKEKIRNITEGYGADIVIESSGSAAGASLCLDIVRKKGQYLQMGLFGKPIEIDFEKILYKEISVTGSFAQKWDDWETAISLLSEKKISLEKLITHSYPLSAWQEGFETFRRKDGMKILLDPRL